MPHVYITFDPLAASALRMIILSIAKYSGRSMALDD
jgi:hypothetical protein